MSVNFNSNTNVNLSYDDNEITNINEDLSNDSSFSIFSSDTNSSDYDIYNLSEDNIELIKEELERKVTELKEELENSQNTRGWAASLWNSAASLLGGG